MTKNRGACCQGQCTPEGTCECQPDYRGASCAWQCPLDSGGNICSNRGTCEASNRAAFCVCEWGKSGPTCEFDCPRAEFASGNTTVSLVCSGCAEEPCAGNRVSQGTCNLQGGCDCSLPPHSDQIDNPLIIWPDRIAPADPIPLGYINTNCNVSCNVDANGRYCSGHGACGLDGSCFCTLGYSGDSCEVHELSLTAWPVTPMANGFAGPTHERCELCVNGTVCCGGVCNDAEIERTGFGCDCKKSAMWEFHGPACELVCPATIDGVCNNWGVCDEHARCNCDNRTRGHDCGIVCPFNEDGVCHGRGVCTEEGDWVIAQQVSDSVLCR